MVGIKDFEMPSCCGECQMASCQGLCGFYCDITTYNVDMDDTERDADCPLVEAVPRDKYEARLKADMAAMLEEIQLEVAELPAHVVSNKGSIIRMEVAPSAEDVYEVIQQKIDKLKGENK